ncbi:MAG: GNAT family N-acetyltransferase [Bacteroidetes bacterium]|nr:GNAT family N-acetyltransferase [Bacteroidota bacterium]
MNAEVLITKIGPGYGKLLSELGRQSFVESHGQSASAEVIEEYTVRNYTEQVFEEMLSDSRNHIHLMTVNDEPAGYSKISFDALHPLVRSAQAAKLDRLYLLNKFHDLKLGHRLLQFNIAYSQKFNQDSMWLFVWKGNERAVKFYLKAGFEVKGSHDFKLTENHSNPNHLMVLDFNSRK